MSSCFVVVPPVGSALYSILDMETVIDICIYATNINIALSAAASKLEAISA